MQMDDDLFSLTLPGPSIICVFKKSLFFSSGEFHLENASHTQRRRRRTKRLHFAVHQMILGPAAAAKFRKDFPLLSSLFVPGKHRECLYTSVIWSALLSFKCRFTSWINIILKLAKTTSSILEFSLGNYTVSMWLFAKELDLATFETKLESKMQEINSTS